MGILSGIESTAFEQRSKTGQCAVGSPRSTPKTIIVASYTAFPSLKRP